MSLAETPNTTPARPALVALAAIVLSWLAEIAAQVGAFGPGARFRFGVCKWRSRKALWSWRVWFWHWHWSGGWTCLHAG